MTPAVPTSCHFRAVPKAKGKEVVNEIASDSQNILALSTAAVGAVVLLTVTARNSAGESPAGAVAGIAVP